MTLGVSEDHRALHDTARRWVEAREALRSARDTLDEPTDALPPFWDELAGMGWLGLHVDEAHGGSGYGLTELAVVLEELGRACAPGPIVPTVLAAAVIDRLGDDDARAAYLPGLVDGSSPGAVAFASDPAVDEWTAVLGAVTAGVVVVPMDDGWSVVPAAGLAVEEHKSLDPTRRLATVRLADKRSGHRLGDEPRPGFVRDLAATLLAAESTGGAAWCVDTAAAYAKDREQFGRPIGQYQAVKHRCADMLGALELARAATWDAVRGGDEDEVAVAMAVTGALARDAYATCAQGCVQVHGGIGFTWEHDAHLFLRRAMATRQLLGGEEGWRALVVERASGGARRSMTVDLPPEAEDHRARVRSFLDDLQAQPRDEWDAMIADTGYLVPNWPEPWGLEADADPPAGDRRGVPGGPHPPPPPAGGGLGPADARGPRHRGPAGALHPTDPAGRDPLVPDVQRARRRLGPRLAQHPGREGRGRLVAHRPEGVDHDGPHRRLGHLPGPYGPRCPQAPRHQLLPRRHDHRRASTSVRCGS